MKKLKEMIAENGGFQHWFVNVFWYHYKWIVLVSIAVVGIIGFITWDAMRRTRYDTTVVVATDYYVDEEMLEPLDAVLKEAVGDLDGNGQVNIQYAILYLGDTEVGRQNEERMYLYMTQNDVALYLMSDGIAQAFTNEALEYFTDPLTEYGLPADEDNPVRMNLSENKLLLSCGLENIYLSIMDYTTVTGDTDVKEVRDTAVRMAEAILAADES